MDDVDKYNNYAKMQLFTDFPKKISDVKKNLPKDIAIGMKRHCHMECLCKCVSMGLHLCTRVRLHLCICVLTLCRMKK
jgi:hypothetical protein